MKFRYNTDGNWYKGNTHVHSTASDGGKTFEEIARLYASADYDFLFRTDHWVMSDVQSDKAEYPLLWLDGIEINGRDRGGSDYHVVCLGSFTGLDSKKGLVRAMEDVREQGGILILAHPHWMTNTFEDAFRYGFDGVEVYNNVCNWLNGKGGSGPYWSHMMERNPLTLGLSVDDSHTRPEHPVWNGGWIMVNAPELTRESIFEGIRQGHFYSSCGPEIFSIELRESEVHVRCSPVKFARLAAPGGAGVRRGCFDEQSLTEISLPVNFDWTYMYLEIEDENGKKAWTNHLFVPGD